MIDAVISLAAMGALFGVVLAVASKKFAVEVDPRIESIQSVLPGANCGSCGYPGCAGYAEAVVEGKAPLNACPAGGGAVAEKIAEIMGTAAGASAERKVARLLCNGGIDKALRKYRYEGIQDCHAAAVQFKGFKACSYGCLGMGTCVKACPFGAITMGPDQLPVIDPELCTGCGICVENCPQRVLKTVGVSKTVHVRCINKDKGKDAKSACQTACIKCKICEKNCPEDAIHVVGDEAGSVAVIDYDKCSGCGICAEKCPTKAIEKLLPIETSHHRTTGSEDSAEKTGCVHCGLCQ